MNLFGLIGKTLIHSFSEKYFTSKFKNENISNSEYRLFPLKRIEDIKYLVKNNSSLVGLSVTIPYKKTVIAYLDEIDDIAKMVGSVNTIKITRNENKTTLKGYNTDILGFGKSLKPLLKSHHKKALILGTGGAANAVAFSLTELKIDYLFVSRNSNINYQTIQYEDITKNHIKEYPLIINTTPLGTFPNIDSCPNIPYSYLSKSNLLYDLVYNPANTLFMLKGIQHFAEVKNGYEMLKIQAEEAWNIFVK